ncbi:MAG: hypothetical protein NTV62_02700 [Candidatus Gribaldobacteria bacterium]|nr:hypothetical protein [Candidatus Gribaldobacteria bacterium]
MKYFELDKNEQKVLKDFEAGKLKSIKDVKKETQKYKGYAKQTLNKPKNINIRISSRDLQKIKAKAVEKGMPYQTLVSSTLHQHFASEVRDDSDQKYQPGK